MTFLLIAIDKLQEKMSDTGSTIKREETDVKNETETEVTSPTENINNHLRENSAGKKML
jgi:hypothetical protein